MYSSGQEPRVGDVVRRINGGDEGVVEQLVPGGLNGEEAVQVRWTTVHEHPPGSGIKISKAPSVIPTRHLELATPVT
jgi:hypothetical protein